MIFHGHYDVVPGRPEQFEPQRGGRPADRARRLRHEGRPRGDDVRAVHDVHRPARRARALRVRARRGVRGGRATAPPTCSWRAGYAADFAITGEPTDLHIGVAGQGRAGHAPAGHRPRRPRLDAVAGRQRRAQGRSTSSGEIETLPFARESSELFDRPSINLGRIMGGDALNKVPDACAMDVDVRYLPGQDPEAILAQVRGDGGRRGGAHVHPRAGHRVAHQPVRAGAERRGRALGRGRGR